MSPEAALALIRARTVDREFLAQHLLDVASRQRTNALPWRGQFTPGLPALLIESLAPSGRVLDPFVGSGTTLGEAMRLNLSSFGAEVNPAAISLAQVYELARHDLEERRNSRREAQEAVASATMMAGEDLLGSGAAIHDVLAERHSRASDVSTRTLIAAVLMLAMGNGRETTPARLTRSWNQVAALLDDLPEEPIDVEVAGADARALPISAQSVGMVLTSPPYINVFNYHQNYRPAMELLGWDILPAARSEIGSNRKHRGNRFLTVIQYCLDMAEALDEILRVTVSGAPVVFVVGRESRVRGLAFPNGDILAGLAESTPGLAFERWQERSFTNRFGGRIFEEVLTFRRTGADNAPALDKGFARALGRHLLLEAQAQGAEGEEAAGQLATAIATANEVAPSPPLTLERLGLAG